MTKTQNNLITRALKKGDNMLACKLALLANIEGAFGASAEVYLPNAYNDVKESITPKQWAGYLSQLQQQGFYVGAHGSRENGFWGYVKG